MNKTLKNALAVLCAVLLLALPGFSALAAESEEPSALFAFTEIPIYTDDEYIGTGYMVDSVTYVPLFNFIRLMLPTECTSDWDQETGTATLTAEGFSASLTIGQDYMTVNGRYLYFPDGAYNINGTIIVPIRELARVFGLSLLWDEESFAVYLSADSPALLTPGEEFYDEEDLYWLSRVISTEAGNQPLDGMIGVGNVVLNRRDDPSGAFGETVRDVIFQPSQFNVVSSGVIYNEPRDSAVVAAKLCLEGYNTVGDCKWFVNPRIGAVSWFNKYKTLVVSIADHDFYA